MPVQRVGGGYLVEAGLGALGMGTVTFEPGVQAPEGDPLKADLEGRTIETPFYRINWNAEGALTRVYRHRASETGPDFDIYYWSGDDPGGAFAGVEAVTVDGSPVLLPAPFGDVAALEGARAGDSEWQTLWHVLAPTDRLLSVQAHLVAADGTRQVADSLGYTADQWQAGDRFIQRHAFGEDAPPGELESGLYDYTSGEPLAGSLRLRTPGREG
jgi:hypothetical protein